MAIRHGVLKLNENGRWEIEGGGPELTSGAVIEVYLQGSWIKGRIEYQGASERYILAVPAGPMGEAALYLLPGMKAKVTV